VDTRERPADGDGVGTCCSVLMGSVSVVGGVIGRFVFPPVYGVAVAASRGRDGNGFVVRGCLLKGYVIPETQKIICIPNFVPFLPDRLPAKIIRPSHLCPDFGIGLLLRGVL